MGGGGYAGFTLGLGHRSMTYQNQKWPIFLTWSQSVTYRFFVDAVTKRHIDLLFFKMTDDFFCQSVNDLWRQNPRVVTGYAMGNPIQHHLNSTALIGEEGWGNLYVVECIATRGLNWRDSLHFMYWDTLVWFAICDVCMYNCMDGCLYVWMYGYMDRWMYACMY